jgi:CRP-like cAMP-binding protein
LDFQRATRRALTLDVQEVYASVLALLADCYPQPRGNLAHEETRGASYSRLAAICHAWGMTKSERVGFYPVAEAIPLSDRHASHILGRLKRRAA